jgi:P27 family predicted phage terminase small subunit
MTRAKYSPPAGLSTSVRRFWNEIATNWTLNAETAELLGLACHAKERARLARLVLQKEGLTITTRGGGIRAHPAAKILKEAEDTMMRALRAMGLE